MKKIMILLIAVLVAVGIAGEARAFMGSPGKRRTNVIRPSYGSYGSFRKGNRRICRRKPKLPRKSFAVTVKGMVGNNEKSYAITYNAEEKMLIINTSEGASPHAQFHFTYNAKTGEIKRYIMGGVIVVTSNPGDENYESEKQILKDRVDAAIELAKDGGVITAGKKADLKKAQKILNQ